MFNWIAFISGIAHIISVLGVYYTQQPQRPTSMDYPLIVALFVTLVCAVPGLFLWRFDRFKGQIYHLRMAAASLLFVLGALTACV